LNRFDKHVFIHQGDLLITKKEIYIHTILGSCVSIVFYDKISKLTGVSHCLLPTILNDRSEKNHSEYRYVDKAIFKLRDTFLPKISNIENLEIKIFGGSKVLMINENNKMDVGSQNVKRAKQILQELNLKINKEDVGGQTARKIIVSTSNGIVYLKKQKITDI
jgi:chemotaxis protein CheD